MKDHLLEALRNACWWQGWLGGERGPRSSVWLVPAVCALKSSAASQLVNGSGFVLSGTKSGFCELLLVPHFLVIFIQVCCAGRFGTQSRTLMWDLVGKAKKRCFRSWYFGIMSLGKSSVKKVYTTLVLPHSNPCCVNKASPEASVPRSPSHCTLYVDLEAGCPKGGLATCFVHMNFEPVLWRSSSMLLPP